MTPSDKQSYSNKAQSYLIVFIDFICMVLVLLSQYMDHDKLVFNWALREAQMFVVHHFLHLIPDPFWQTRSNHTEGFTFDLYAVDVAIDMDDRIVKK